MSTHTRCCFISAARSHQRWRRNIQNIPPDRPGGRPRWQAAGRQVLCLIEHASSRSPTPPLPLSLEQLFFKRSLAVSWPAGLLTWLRDDSQTHTSPGLPSRGSDGNSGETWFLIVKEHRPGRIRWTQSTFLFSTWRDWQSSSWTRQESLRLAWCPHQQKEGFFFSQTF